MMKKYLALILTFALFLTLFVGCSNEKLTTYKGEPPHLSVYYPLTLKERGLFAHVEEKSNGDGKVTEEIGFDAAGALIGRAEYEYLPGSGNAGPVKKIRIFLGLDLVGNPTEEYAYTYENEHCTKTEVYGENVQFNFTPADGEITDGSGSMIVSGDWISSSGGKVSIGDLIGMGGTPTYGLLYEMRYEYGKDGTVEKIQSYKENGELLCEEYNDGKVRKVTYASGEKIETTYHENGVIGSVKATDNTKTVYSYEEFDEYGRTIRTIEYSDAFKIRHCLKYGYDNDGYIIRIDYLSDDYDEKITTEFQYEQNKLTIVRTDYHDGGIPEAVMEVTAEIRENVVCGSGLNNAFLSLGSFVHAGTFAHAPVLTVCNLPYGKYADPDDGDLAMYAVPVETETLPDLRNFVFDTGVIFSNSRMTKDVSEVYRAAEAYKNFGAHADFTLDSLTCLLAYRGPMSGLSGMFQEIEHKSLDGWDIMTTYEYWGDEKADWKQRNFDNLKAQAQRYEKWQKDECCVNAAVNPDGSLRSLEYTGELATVFRDENGTIQIDSFYGKEDNVYHTFRRDNECYLTTMSIGESGQSAEVTISFVDGLGSKIACVTYEINNEYYEPLPVADGDDFVYYFDDAEKKVAYRTSWGEQAAEEAKTAKDVIDQIAEKYK